MCIYWLKLWKLKKIILEIIDVNLFIYFPAPYFIYLRIWTYR